MCEEIWRAHCLRSRNVSAKWRTILNWYLSNKVCVACLVVFCLFVCLWCLVFVCLFVWLCCLVVLFGWFLLVCLSVVFGCLFVLFGWFLFVYLFVVWLVCLFICLLLLLCCCYCSYLYTFKSSTQQAENGTRVAVMTNQDSPNIRNVSMCTEHSWTQSP